MKRQQTKYKTEGPWRIDPKTGRYMSFVYYDSSVKKNVRIGREAGWPNNIFSLVEALTARGRLIGKIDAEHLISKKRLDWINKYQNFGVLILEYETFAKKKAPNSWFTNMSNLRNYTFHWFLDLKALNNPLDWSWHYDEFTDWLLAENSLRVGKQRLSKNTMNNILNATNAFFTFLEKKHRMGPFLRIEKVPVGKNERRGVEAIYSNDEQATIESQLREAGVKFGTYFRLLCKSGMRPNEALGLHTGSIIIGEFPTEKKFLFRKIKDAGMQVYGYIVLRDQPASRSIINKDRSIPRKPLKHRKEIASQHNRYIPILDKELAQELKELRKSALKIYANEEDQLLFGFTYQKFYTQFYKIRARLKISRDKDVYSARHTFITWITKATGGDRLIAEEIVGHNSKEINDRYLHLGQELEATIKNRAQDDDSVEIKAIAID